MTFSVPRSLAEKYLGLCNASPLAASIAHDFVIAQLALRYQILAPAADISMLYIQHASNTIGYAVGFRWLLQKLRTFHEIAKCSYRYADLLDLIYGDRCWLQRGRLHGNKYIAVIFRMLLIFR
jgi:hypothetical protein